MGRERHDEPFRVFQLIERLLDFFTIVLEAPMTKLGHHMVQ
jgi:hypothetical protein